MWEKGNVGKRECGKKGMWERGGKVGERESGREGKWERGKVGERESGKKGEWERGRVGEWERGGRVGERERERGRVGEWVPVYVDDILVASESAEQHVEDLRRVFEILEANGLEM